MGRGGARLETGSVREGRVAPSELKTEIALPGAFCA